MGFLSRLFNRRRNQWCTVEGSGWQLRLPADWTSKPSTLEGVSYFESRDTTKGVYVSAWHGGPQHSDEAETLLEEFLQGERKKLLDMDGYHWTFTEERSFANDQSLAGIVDGYDSKKSYRILNKVIVNVPLIVRSSFHDYDCRDYEASKEFFAPIADSLQYQQVQA
jgi:hypothetical protein